MPSICVCISRDIYGREEQAFRGVAIFRISTNKPNAWKLCASAHFTTCCCTIRLIHDTYWFEYIKQQYTPMLPVDKRAYSTITELMSGNVAIVATQTLIRSVFLVTNQPFSTDSYVYNRHNLANAIKTESLDYERIICWMVFFPLEIRSVWEKMFEKKKLLQKAENRLYLLIGAINQNSQVRCGTHGKKTTEWSQHETREKKMWATQHTRGGKKNYRKKKHLNRNCIQSQSVRSIEWW